MTRKPSCVLTPVIRKAPCVLKLQVVLSSVDRKRGAPVLLMTRKLPTEYCDPVVVGRLTTPIKGVEIVRQLGKHEG